MDRFAVALVLITPIIAAPLASEGSQRSAAVNEKLADDALPELQIEDSPQSPPRDLFPRAVFRGGGYYGGSGSSSGGGSNSDWWKIALGIAGGVLLALAICYIVKIKKQRQRFDRPRTAASSNPSISPVMRSRMASPPASVQARPSGQSSNPIRVTDYDTHRLGSGFNAATAYTGPGEMVRDAMGRISWVYRSHDPVSGARQTVRSEVGPNGRVYTREVHTSRDGLVVTRGESQGRSVSAPGPASPSEGTRSHAGDVIQMPAPAYVKDAPDAMVLATGPPKYESAPPSPVDRVGSRPVA